MSLLAAVALVVIGGREGLYPVGALDWFPSISARQPIRAAINIASGRAGPAGRADCRIARVIDGDTVDLDCPGDGFVRTRLLGFDTPEVVSPQCASELSAGTAATTALERKVRLAGEMHVAFRGSDRYGRSLARLSLDGTDIAEPMIAEGFARPYDGGRRRSWCG